MLGKGISSDWLGMGVYFGVVPPGHGFSEQNGLSE